MHYLSCCLKKNTKQQNLSCSEFRGFVEVCERTYVHMQSMASLHCHSSWQFLESCLESHPATPKASAKRRSQMIQPPPAIWACTVLSVLQGLCMGRRRERSLLFHGSYLRGEQIPDRAAFFGQFS